MQQLVKNLIGNAVKARRNARVLLITRGTWQSQRLSMFQHNVRFAASAKSTRTALEVTQQEVADHYGVTSAAVCHWESGHYGWKGGKEELSEYLRICERIAK